MLTVSEAATNASCVGSCNIQLVKVAAGCKAAGSRRRSATRPRVHSAPLTSSWGRRRWLIGQLVDELRLARVRSGTLVNLHGASLVGAPRSIGGIGMPSSAACDGQYQTPGIAG